MNKKILGISGSPIKNSNTDRVIKRLMEETGYQTEFVKLSRITVKPCFGCKKCVKDNICKVKDDFPELAQKLINADAVILGGYIPFGQLDGFTKAFTERLWALKHDNTLLKDKPWVTVLNGLQPHALEEANKALAKKLVESDKVNLLGQLSLSGNVPCNTCGKGEACKTNALHKMREVMNDSSLTINDFPYADSLQDERITKEISELASKIVSVP